MPQVKTNWLFLLITILTTVCLLTSEACMGQSSVEWRTGGDLAKQLEASMDLTWDSVGLRGGLQRISHAQKVAVFLDRRIDPDREVTLSLRSTSVGNTFAQIAASVGCRTAQVGDVIYIGPAETAEALPTVAEIQSEFAKSHTSPAVVKLVEKRSFGWQRLAKPRDILNQFSQQHQLPWKNLEEVIPHDLWPEVDLPKIKSTEFLTLVLAGYGATYRFDANGAGVAMELIPIPEDLTLTREHSFAGNHREAVAKIKELYPDAKVNSDGNRKIEVTAPHEAQVQIAKLLRGGTARTTEVVPGKRVYTVNTKNPIGLILKSFAPQLGLELDLPADVDQELNQLVSVSVENAERDVLLDAIFADSDFTYEVSGTKLIVKPKP